MLSEPLPYHIKIRDYFKRQSGIWSFFSAARKKEEQLITLKTELLKNTYQFQPGSDPLLYEKINIIRERLGLGDLPVKVYQSAHSTELNASIVCLPNEAHMVFSGGVLQLLDERELLALIGHELAHIKLYSLPDGDLEITDRIITALAGSPDSEASHYETARLFRLYTEIWCDRVAYEVLGEAGPVITMLLKMATGLPTVHAESYIRQAEEIFAGEAGLQSASLTHPENFIRTRALHLWEEARAEMGGAAEGTSAGAGEAVAGEASTGGERGKNAEEAGAGDVRVTKAAEAIAKMIEGVMELDRLDVLAQKELAELTRALLMAYLRPEWFQTPMVVALARQYFPDIKNIWKTDLSGNVAHFPETSNDCRPSEDLLRHDPPWSEPSVLDNEPPARSESEKGGGSEGAAENGRLSTFLGGAHLSIREYFAYVLLDFALADPELEDVPMQHAVKLAEVLGLGAEFETIAKKELTYSSHAH